MKGVFLPVREFLLSLVLSVAVFILGLILFLRRGKPTSSRWGAGLVSLLLLLGVVQCRDVKKDDPRQEKSSVRNNVENERVQRLNSSPEWKELREFWAELTRAEDFAAEYRGNKSFTYEQYQQYVEKWDNLSPKLEQMTSQGLISPLEANVLRNLFYERLSYTYGKPFAVMTRMAPPPSEMEKERSMYSLEKRLDQIQKLRDKGLVSGEDYELLLSGIFNDAVYLYLMNIIKDFNDPIPLLFDTSSPSPSYTNMIRHYYQTLSNQLYSRADTNRFLMKSGTISRLESELPGLHQLINHLVNGK